jgi:hypothetical protein
MKRFYLKVLAFATLLIIVFFIDTLFFGFFHPFGCDYKGMHLKESEGGFNVILHSNYTYKQIYGLVIKNPDYEVTNTESQFYLTRTIGPLKINLIVKDMTDHVTYNFNLYGTESRSKSTNLAGADCSTPNFLISNNIKKFIIELYLPKDLEQELLKSYYVSSVTFFRGGL